MVKIIDSEQRKNKEGEPFTALSLQGDLVMVQSSETGRFYAMAKKCTITSTFSEDEAKAKSLLLMGEAVSKNGSSQK